MKFIVDFQQTYTTHQIQAYFSVQECLPLKHWTWLGSTYLVEASQPPQHTDGINAILSDQTIPIMLFGTQQIINTDDVTQWWKLATIDIKNYDAESIIHYRNTLPVNVYVFDTGCDLVHPEFAGTNAAQIYSYDGSIGDSTGHGTAVASIIGGTNLSLANVNLRILKICGNAEPLLSQLLTALDTAIDDHKRHGIPSIAVCSWGTHRHAFLESKIQQLFNNDIMIVCAAGSNGMKMEELTPQSTLYTAVVGAYNQDFEPVEYTTGADPINQHLVNGGVIDVWAPGENITAAEPGNNYTQWSGTSIAAAIHASALAHIVGGYYTTHPVGKYLSSKNFLYSLNTAVACGRSNMIELGESADRYSNKTAITTVRSQIRNAADIMLNKDIVTIMLVSGEYVADKLFYTTGIESVTVVEGSMPVGLSFVDGCIIGTTPKIDGSMELYVFRIQFKMIDASVYHQKLLKIKLINKEG